MGRVEFKCTVSFQKESDPTVFDLKSFLEIKGFKVHLPMSHGDAIVIECDALPKPEVKTPEVPKAKPEKPEVKKKSPGKGYFRNSK